MNIMNIKYSKNASCIVMDDFVVFFKKKNLKCLQNDTIIYNNYLKFYIILQYIMKNWSIF
jgi:hypothetical protein